MRVVKIPEPVTVEIARKIGGVIEFQMESRTFQTFLQTSLDTFDIFSKGHVNALMYAKLTKIVSGADLSKGEIWFEDEDFKKVEAAAEAAPWISPKMNAAFIPFREALKQARTEVLSTENKS